MNTVKKLDLRAENGDYDYDRITELLDIKKGELANFLDIDRGSLKNPPSPKLLASLTPYISILKMLWENFEGDSAQISKWLHDPLKDWLFYSPIEMMKRHKTEKVREYLISKLDQKSDLFNG